MAERPSTGGRPRPVKPKSQAAVNMEQRYREMQIEQSRAYLQPYLQYVCLHPRRRDGRCSVTSRPSLARKPAASIALFPPVLWTILDALLVPRAVCVRVPAVMLAHPSLVSLLAARRRCRVPPLPRAAAAAP